MMKNNMRHRQKYGMMGKGGGKKKNIPPAKKAAKPARPVIGQPKQRAAPFPSGGKAGKAMSPWPSTGNTAASAMRAAGKAGAAGKPAAKVPQKQKAGPKSLLGNLLQKAAGAAGKARQKGPLGNLLQKVAGKGLPAAGKGPKAAKGAQKLLGPMLAKGAAVGKGLAGKNAKAAAGTGKLLGPALAKGKDGVKGLVGKGAKAAGGAQKLLGSVLAKGKDGVKGLVGKGAKAAEGARGLLKAALGKGADGVKGLVGKGAKAMEGAKELAAQVIGKGGEAVRDLAGKGTGAAGRVRDLLVNVAGKGAKAAGSIRKAGVKLGKAGLKKASGMGEALKTGAAKLGKAGLAKAAQLGGGIKEKAAAGLKGKGKGILDTVKKEVSGFGEGVKDSVVGIWDGLKGAAKGVANWTKAAAVCLTTPKDKRPEWAKEGVRAPLDSLKEMAGGVKAILKDPVGVMKQVGTMVKETVKEKGVGYLIGRATPEILGAVLTGGAGAAVKGGMSVLKTGTKVAKVAGKLAAGTKVGQKVVKTANSVRKVAAGTKIGQKAVKTASSISRAASGVKKAAAGSKVANGARKAVNGFKNTIEGAKNAVAGTKLGRGAAKAADGMKALKAKAADRIGGMAGKASARMKAAGNAIARSKAGSKAISTAKNIGQRIAGSRIGKGIKKGWDEAKEIWNGLDAGTGRVSTKGTSGVASETVGSGVKKADDVVAGVGEATKETVESGVKKAGNIVEGTNAGTKVGGSGGGGTKPPSGFSEMMSPEDAARYNQHWDDVTSGKHLPPGMNQEGYVAYQRGAKKLDEAVALNKVDYNEVSKLRTEGKVPRGTSGADSIPPGGFRDMMSPEEVARYDKHWENVAHKISDEAIDNEILRMNNGNFKTPSGKAYEPRKVSAAVDMNNGDISMGYSGKRGYNPSKPDYANGEKLHPDLQERINKTKTMASNDVNNQFRDKGSFENWSVDNCAEVFAVDKSLKNGGEMGNIFLNTKTRKTGAYAPPCDNCKVTFNDFIMPGGK